MAGVYILFQSRSQSPKHDTTSVRPAADMCNNDSFASFQSTRVPLVLVYPYKLHAVLGRRWMSQNSLRVGK